MQVGNTITVLLMLLVLIGCGTAQPTTAPVIPAPATPQPTASALSGANTLIPTNSNQISGSYLGQKMLGSFSARFAPAFIKGELHTSPVFMPDGSEVYWSSQEPRIDTMKLENGYWTQPKSIAFSDSLTDYRDLFISPPGDKLFFLSRGRLLNSQLPEKENIWFVERVGDGWGEPQPLGEEVNALTLHWQVSVAANGNLYFTSGETGFEDIYISRYVSGQYIKPERLSDLINTDQLETTPYIAPDESYINFARLKDSNSYSKLYINYSDRNGN